MPPTIHILPVTLADSSAITLNNLLANQSSHNTRLTWPHRSLSYRIAQVNARMPRTLLSNPLCNRSQKAVDAENGVLMGYARWHLPLGVVLDQDGKEVGERDEEGRKVWGEAIVPRVSEEEEQEIGRVAESVEWDPKPGNQRMFDGVREIKNEILGRRDFIRLDVLAVAPEHQRKGIGTALVRSGMREAEKLGLDVFCHSTKEGVPLYKRLGFKIEREIIQDDSIYGGTGEHYTCFMIYEQTGGSCAN